MSAYQSSAGRLFRPAQVSWTTHGAFGDKTGGGSLFPFPIEPPEGMLPAAVYLLAEPEDEAADNFVFTPFPDEVVVEDQPPAAIYLLAEPEDESAEVFVGGVFEGLTTTFFTFDQATWAWSAADVQINDKTQLTLDAASWPWAAGNIGINSKTMISLAQAAWNWTTGNIAINSKTMLTMAQATWAWTVQNLSIEGGLGPQADSLVQAITGAVRGAVAMLPWRKSGR